MSYFEYRVVPAPKSVPRVKGVKTAEGRFALSMAELLNSEGRDGWEFQSTETIETELKAGFFSKKKVERLSVLVFRRWVEVEELAERVPQRSEPEAPPSDPAPTVTDLARPTLSARRDEAPQGSAPSLAPPRRD
ncbi:DUF4177 domain-containing protein [Palleronia sp.]|uniref:DUF4177 domain-containing protein n=1 Tax=Palleronia sp. TaxID=1940284 RepID=UPI0035C7BF22